MTAEVRGPQVRFDTVDGVALSWTLDEAMERSSHALVDDGRVWIVDPVDVGDALDRAVSLGRPEAVVQLLDRHNRDCADVARRLGVPHLAVPDAVPGSPFASVPVTDHRWWREVALWWPRHDLLVVAEAVGTGRFFTAGRGPVGVHPLERLVPPRRALGGYAPRHLLVGHGAPVHGEDAARGLRFALADSRRGIPAFLRRLPSLWRPAGAP